MGGRRNKRAPLPVLPRIDLIPVLGTWRVTLTNGSGLVSIDLDGTSTSAWAWATEAGRKGGIREGNWQPKDIELVKLTSGSFNVV